MPDKDPHDDRVTKGHIEREELPARVLASIVGRLDGDDDLVIYLQEHESEFHGCPISEYGLFLTTCAKMFVARADEIEKNLWLNDQLEDLKGDEEG